MNKVVLMIREIGAQPVLAFGNSSTDASMLNYTIIGNRYKALGFMLCCDDLEREYGNMAKAEEMRKASERNGWIPVSMRSDWKTIYGDKVKKCPSSVAAFGAFASGELDEAHLIGTTDKARAID